MTIILQAKRHIFSSVNAAISTSYSVSAPALSLLVRPSLNSQTYWRLQSLRMSWLFTQCRLK